MYVYITMSGSMKKKMLTGFDLKSAEDSYLYL